MSGNYVMIVERPWIIRFFFIVTDVVGPVAKHDCLPLIFSLVCITGEVCFPLNNSVLIIVFIIYSEAVQNQSISVGQLMLYSESNVLLLQ